MPVDPTDVNSIPVTVEGCKAIARIEHYDPGEPARLFGHPDSCHPGYPEVAEWTLYDRNGEFDRELDAKLDDPVVWDDVDNQVQEAIHKARRKASERAEESKMFYYF